MRFAGKDTVLKVGDGDELDETFATVGQLMEIGEVGRTRDLIDASAFGDDDKEYVTGMGDGSELTLTLALDPSNAVHGVLKDNFDSNTRSNFQLVHPDGERTLTFAAVYTSYNEQPERDGLYQATVGIKITGPIEVSGVSS